MNVVCFVSTCFVIANTCLLSNNLAAGLSRRFDGLAWNNVIATGVASEKLHSSLNSLVDNITDLLVTLGADSESKLLFYNHYQMQIVFITNIPE